MTQLKLDDLYAELRNTKSKRSFEEAKIDLGTVSEYNLEIICVLIYKYHLENGGTIREVQAKIPFKGKKANKNGGVFFNTDNMPTELLNIITNFLDKIKSD